MMNEINGCRTSKHSALKRRTLLKSIPAAAGLLALPSFARAADYAKRQFTIDLCPGRVGIKAGQDDTIALAKKFGYESVEPFGAHLAGLGQEAKTLPDRLAEDGLVWGAAGLSVEFRKDDATFRAGLKEFPSICKGLQTAGVTRVGTWLKPNHAELSYLENFRLHARRLKQIAKILGDHGLRFGLEYVGPRTLWTAAKHPFIHSMVETKQLIERIGETNVGFVLDSWHWYTAEETVADLMTLTNNDIVAVDLNDAPAGIDVSEQIDNQRELPAATGVIDVKAFLQALTNIGYDGPVRAEPFNKPLNALDNETAAEKTADAIRKAFAQLD